MAQADKAIVQAFYGMAPTHSYFNGCSFGGKQALTEAQRYPKDFDGIIAGDPANNFTRHYIGGHLFDALAMDGDGYIPAAKVPLIGNAVNAACDALDGVKDGVLSDPRRCHFDPASLQCKNGDAADLLDWRASRSDPQNLDGAQGCRWTADLPGTDAWWRG